jgi:protocatechuate 3,4-dioxygenase beta subunit
MPIPFPRRRLLATLGAGALLPSLARAAMLLPTPRQSLGPFYPDILPLDQDNDLAKVPDQAPAEGVITHVQGRLLDPAGRPLAGALVEIWQCDAKGRYIHSRDAARGGGDPGFQGFGRTLSDDQGRYRFRTIRPTRAATAFAPSARCPTPGARRISTSRSRRKISIP